MSDMKCPFCQQEMIEHPFVSNTGVAAYSCCNKDCEIHDKYIIAPIMKMLDRTKKQLEIAIDALKVLEKELYFNNAKQTGHIADSVMSIPSIALEQITALEQKTTK